MFTRVLPRAPMALMRPLLPVRCLTVLNWTTMNLPPANIGPNNSTLLGEDYYIFYRNGVLDFNFPKQEWTRAKAKPTAVSGPSSVMVFSTPRVIGSATIKNFNVKTEAIVDVPKCEFTFSTKASLGGQVWLFGGDYHDEINEHPLQWIHHKCSGEPPQEAKKLAVVPYDGKFFVFTKELVLELFILDPATLTWSKPEVKGVGYATEKGAQVLIGKKIVFWGGLEASSFNLLRKDTNRAEVFDISTMAWDTVEQIGSVPRSRKEHSLTCFQNELYLVGGKTEWKELTDMAVCRLE